MTKIIRYKIKKAMILNTIPLLTDLLLYRTGMIPLGCRDLLNSKNPFLIMIMCLTIFTPPAVEPAEAPKNINTKKSTVKKGDQMEKSADTNPVVVITAST